MSWGVHAHVRGGCVCIKERETVGTEFFPISILKWCCKFPMYSKCVILPVEKNLCNQEKWLSLHRTSPALAPSDVDIKPE